MNNEDVFIKSKESGGYDFDIIHMIKVIFRHLWIVAILGAVMAGVAFSGAKFVLTPEYASNVMFYVNNNSKSSANNLFGMSSSDLMVAQSLVDTYIVILGTRSTLTEVIEQADVDYTYSEMSRMVSAAAVNETEIFRVTVTTNDPKQSKHIANTIAEVLPEKISDTVDGSSVRIVDTAVIETERVSPNITVYTIIGFLAGVLIGCALVILEDMLNDIIKNEDEVIQSYNVPILAVIPSLSAESSSTYGRYASAYATAGRKGK